MEKSQKISISFSKAKEVIDEYRYRPRREWSKEERFFFKICNFVVLSKKRVNKIFSAINSFRKLSDKSHYNYNEFDIIQIKELILDNLEGCFQNFFKDIKVVVKDKTLIIDLIEYPVINEVIVVGEKTKKYQDAIKENIKSKKTRLHCTCS